MKNDLNIFSRAAVTAATPQAQAITDTVPNAAGGYAFAVDDWARLNRLLILGSEGGSIADPDDAGTLDVVGFATATPAVIADFIRQD